MIRIGLVVVACVLALAGSAAAQNGDGSAPEAPARLELDPDAYLQSADALFTRLQEASPVLENIAKGTLRRARRKVSIGPTVGVFGGYADGIDAAVSFGIGLETFKIPVLPNIENLKAIAKERAKAKLKEVLADTLKGKPLDQVAFEQLAAEVWEEAVKEVLGMDNIRAKTMERPSLSVGIEGNHYFDAGVTGLRVRAGVGIWKFTLGAAATWLATDPTWNVYLAPEVVVHFLTSKGPRASVLDVFVRADFEVRNRGEAHSDDIYVVGARYLIDVL